MTDNRPSLADDARLARAQLSLEGLSVGDAFGQTYFVKRGDETPGALIAARRPAPAPWPLSDDSIMALEVVAVLRERGAIDQDLLARRFADAFSRDMERGYGAVAHWMLYQIAQGMPWREASSQVFRGTGSMGNGGAMRVAPLGAFFADDLDGLVANARASAAVTHAHPEGQAGAIAVALAAAYACGSREGGAAPSDEDLLSFVIARTPDGDTRGGLVRARALAGQPPAIAARALGDGSKVISSDTVPFAIFCAAANLDDYATAIWRALEGLASPESDRDTILAIVGGVVALSAGRATIPAEWIAAREPLPT